MSKRASLRRGSKSKPVAEGYELLEQSEEAAAATDTPPHSVSDDNADLQQNGRSFRRFSFPSAFVHFFQCNISLAVVIIPSAVASVGLTIGTIGVVLTGLVYMYTAHVLFHCRRLIVQDDGSDPSSTSGAGNLDYALVAEYAFRKPRVPGSTESRFGSVFGRRLGHGIAFFSLLAHVGYGCAYILLSTSLIQNLAEDAASESNFHEFVRTKLLYYSFLTALLFVYIGLPKDFAFIVSRRLMVAAALECFGVGVIFYGLCWDVPAINPVQEVHPSFADLATFVSLLLFAFEGSFLVIEGESTTRDESDGNRTRTHKTLHFARLLARFVALTLITVEAFMAFSKFGRETEMNIFGNLPKSAPLYLAAQGSIAVALFLTSFSHLQPVIREIDHFCDFVSRPNCRSYCVLHFYWLLASALTAICMVTEDLDLFIEFIGSFAVCPLVIAVPALIEVATYKNMIDSKLLRNHVFIKDSVALIVAMFIWASTVFTWLLRLTDRIAECRPEMNESVASNASSFPIIVDAPEA